MRSEDEILRAFEGLDTAPGSRHPRREPTERSEQQRKKAFTGSNGWDENPIIKTVNGIETELFTVSALAQALDKQVVTIRLWEKKGYFPVAPYRLRSKTLNGNKVGGNRVYTRALIEIAIEEFEKRRLLGSARIEWSRFRDLTYALVERWSEATQQHRES